MTISIKARESNILPAGTYYVGDLCYLFGDKADDLYQEYVCGVSCNDDKAVDIKAGSRKEFSAFYGSTNYGDGEYEDNLHNKYSVDAGILGVVQLLSKDFIEEAKKIDAEGYAKIIEFKKDFRVDCDKDGTFTFGHLTIITDGSDQQEDTEDSWGEEEDEENQGYW